MNEEVNDDRNDGAVDDAGDHADDDIVDANGGAAEALDYAGDAEDDDDEYITVGFNRTLMEIRVNALKHFLQYRRNSFKFPSGSVEIQFVLFLKLYCYEFQRTLMPLDTSKYILDHFSGIIMLERLFSKFLKFNHTSTPFAVSEGWNIGPIRCDCQQCSKLNSYLYNDPQLNFLHFNLK